MLKFYNKSISLSYEKLNSECVINPLKGQTSKRKIFNGSDIRILCKIIKEYPDFYLDEIVKEMIKKTNKEVSILTLWRSLKFCDITRKKIEKVAKERSELLRADFIYTIGIEFQPRQLIFLNESSKDDRTLSRNYGYSFSNQSAVKKVVFLQSTRYTILPALIIDGFIACDIIKGSYSKARFRTFILSQVLPLMTPFPKKNSVLVMDNAKIHYDEELIKLIKRIGCRFKQNRDFMKTCVDPEYSIMVACSQIISKLAKSYFKKSLGFDFL
ncbi:homeodomain-like protein [Rhizophagus clarus]|uniref:Homeodomain-like protein n=1 Tax=Rhizophagus clarus TaxID=94130 RepID=A0A8H3QE83_9GLOM|nr:homeodomain-like protein [Rhizophagus clarus]